MRLKPLSSTVRGEGAAWRPAACSAADPLDATVWTLCPSRTPESHRDGEAVMPTCAPGGRKLPVQERGEIAHPVFVFFGWILAGIYAVIPNYAIAITGLTVIIMAALTPLTVKSTKSMIAMQRLQPEMKKLQQKYKGPENRELLNQEMMKLYKESGTSPFGACLPSFLQMPFLFILYNLIKGLSNTVVIHGQTVAQPRYIPTVFGDVSQSGQTKGQMYAFGMNFSAKPFGHHANWYDAIPYVMFIVVAVFLQYYQMKQMNSRNPQAAAANPQMQTMQKIFPLVFAVIYIRVPVGVTLYMVVSSAIRILTQEIMFRSGYVTPVVHEREISASSKVVKKGDGKPSNGAKAAAIEATSSFSDRDKWERATPRARRPSGCRQHQARSSRH